MYLGSYQLIPPCKVGSYFTINFNVKNNMNGKGKVVCGAKTCAGFKPQWKPKTFLCRKTIPLVKGWYVGDFCLHYATDPACNTCLIGVYSRRMAFFAAACVELENYVSGHVFFHLSIAQINYNDCNLALLNSNCHARLGPL